MTRTLDRLVLAARNNALWCDAVARAHGVKATLDDTAWTSPTRTPPYYPDAVTLSPDVRSTTCSLGRRLRRVLDQGLVGAPEPLAGGLRPPRRRRVGLARPGDAAARSREAARVAPGSA